MKYLILGASGLVGGNCLHYFRSKNENVIGTYFSFPVEGIEFFDTLNLNAHDNFDVNAYNPDIIIHCGALTHVDYCEDHKEESFQKTVQSTINAVAMAKNLNAKLVYLSTDYVFDGKKGFYAENDEVNPLGVYAEHKLEAEKHVQSISNYLIVRITNVYGDEVRGKNFISRLIENMQKNEPMDLRLPYDQYATPINAYDIARGIYLLIENQKNGIYHFGSTDYLNRVQLAQKVMHYFGHEKVKLTPIATSEMNQAAKRPLKGGFDTSKFHTEFRNFRFHSVDEYLILKKAGKQSIDFED